MRIAKFAAALGSCRSDSPTGCSPVRARVTGVGCARGARGSRRADYARWGWGRGTPSHGISCQPSNSCNTALLRRWLLWN